MRLPQPPRREPRPLVIVPLINIIFLLLIFFMLFGSFRLPEPFAVEPPTSDGQGPATEQETMVFISADGRLAIGEQELDRDALHRRIEALLVERQDALIKLKADAAVSAYVVIDIMDGMRDAGAGRVVLLTTPPES